MAIVLLLQVILILLIILDQNNSSDGFVTKLQFATAIQIGTPTVTNVNCNGDFSGSISINITGGISPYSFVWSNNSHTQNLNGITAGIYSVTVTDMIGNSATASATVTQPPALAISANLTNTSCFVCNNGMIDLTVTGGTSPYSYLWSNMAVTEDLVNITSDTYKVTVTDNKSCVSTGSYTIIVVYQLQVSLSGTDITCFGSNNGSIDLTMINGTSPFSYIWNNNATSDDLTGLAAGTYSVTVTDFLGFTATSAIIINEPVQFSISGIVTNVTCNGCSNGAININITGGTMPYTFLWSNSATTENLAGIPAGNYSVTVSDANSCSYTASYSVFMVFVPSWPYIVTSSNHTILIQSNSSITINGVPAETGDYLGVFYDVSGSLQCGGYIIWNGQTGSIAAWGDDPQTTVKDGFSTGESFKWKIFDSSTGIEYQASATYASGYPNTGTFSANGMSVVSTLNTSATQYINLPSSWCIFSTYIVPQNTNISQVLGAFTSSVIIVKDEIGNVYWPAYGVNNINNMIIGKGYQLKLSSAQTLSVTGTQIIPELTPLNLLSGWGMLGYLRTSQASVATLMNPIVSSINIMKDGDGNVYWPVYGVNLIVNMIPGKGYQIKTSNAVTYTYPAN
ncbi:MAG: SprB repeat-containing protein [Bacteroidia bacterium]|nr:SprB repeat-containing protein [Bacteroidia bacterium]